MKEPSLESKSGGVRRVAVNSAWNLAGQLLPLIVGVAVLPILIRTMGLERYGFLTLVWVLVGYAGLFDFGIARALTRTVANRLSLGDVPGSLHVSNVGCSYLLMFGLTIGLVFAGGSGLLARHAFGLPLALQDEAAGAMWFLAASIPLVMLSAGYGGILSAHQSFRSQSLLRIGLGLATYLGPLCIVLWCNRLEYVVGFILLMRTLNNMSLAFFCSRDCGFSFRPAWPDRATSVELFSLGGWITVSNLVSPLLSYLDRLILGTLVPIRLVGFYATPFDLVSRSMVIPNSMMGALFPMAAGVRSHSAEAEQMLHASLRALYVLMFPALLTFSVMARPGLELWLGAEFAENGAAVMQILAAGLVFNALAQAPANLIQGTGNPGWMARMHLLELPLFVLLLWALTTRFGIVGTAMASALRNSFDAVAVLIIAYRGVLNKRVPWHRGLIAGCASCILFAMSAAVVTLSHALVFLALALPAFAAYAWFSVLSTGDRANIAQLFRRRAGEKP